MSCGPWFRLLLAQEHPPTRLALARFLRDNGLWVGEAEDCEGALRLLGAMRFDLLITGRAFNDGTGGYLVERAQELGWLRATRVLALPPMPTPIPTELWAFLEEVRTLAQEGRRLWERTRGRGDGQAQAGA